MQLVQSFFDAVFALTGAFADDITMHMAMFTTHFNSLIQIHKEQCDTFVKLYGMKPPTVTERPTYHFNY
jgi:hypothetical protein